MPTRVPIIFQLLSPDVPSKIEKMSPVPWRIPTPADKIHPFLPFLQLEEVHINKLIWKKIWTELFFVVGVSPF
jgi:hypothetical protein